MQILEVSFLLIMFFRGYGDIVHGSLLVRCSPMKGVALVVVEFGVIVV